MKRFQSSALYELEPETRFPSWTCQVYCGESQSSLNCEHSCRLDAGTERLTSQDDKLICCWEKAKLVNAPP